MVDFARLNFEGDPADSRQIRDRLAGKLVLDGEGVSQLLALSLSALAALHGLRGESIIPRRQRRARAAATALVRLAQEAGRITGHAGEGHE
jgi:hypothetical protein